MIRSVVLFTRIVFDYDIGHRHLPIEGIVLNVLRLHHRGVRGELVSCSNGRRYQVFFSVIRVYIARDFSSCTV